MRYYYADGARATFGPVEATELRSLRTRDVIRDDSPVIAEGDAAWGTYASHIEVGASASTVLPPIPPVHDEQWRTDVELRMRQAKAAAATAGSAVASGFVATLRGVRTPGERARLFGALAGLAALPLPWLHFGGERVLGLTIIKDVPYMWLLPLTLLVCIVVAWLDLGAAPHVRVRRARWVLAIGTTWTVVGLEAILFGSRLIGLFMRMVNPFGLGGAPRAGLSIGAWLAAAGVAALAVGAALQIGENTPQPGADSR